jgi:hypothetical protein
LSPGGAIVDFVFQVQSLEQLADRAKVIAEVYVQSTDRGRGINSRLEMPDALLLVTQVLKGPADLRQVEVSHMVVADGFYEMKPGQRFIVFLAEESPNRAALLQDRPGVPRYTVTGDYSGLFCIDGSTIRLSGDSHLRAKYDGATLEKTLADIRAYVGIPRIDGKVAIEGGQFSAASFPAIPFGSDPVEGIRGRFKIVLNPVTAGAARQAMAIHNWSPWGAPVAPLGADVRLSTISPDGAFNMIADPGSYRVRVDGLPFGYYVKSIASGSQDLLTKTLAIAKDVNPSLLVTLTNQPPANAPPVVRVSGRVTDIPDAVNTDGLQVTLVSDAKENIRGGVAQASANGEFEFSNVPSGSYTVTVMPIFEFPPGYTWTGQSRKSIVVTNRNERVELPLLDGVEVRGKVVDNDGNPTAAGAAYVLFDTVATAEVPSKHMEIRLPPDGAFRIWLPAGEYQVKFSSFGNRGAGRPPLSTKTIMSGSLDLVANTLKSDGRSPIAPIVITVQ